MGLELVLDDELPSLPPIQTTRVHTKPVEGLQPGSPAKEEKEYCVTPKSEEHAPRPALVCPPAPRKPRPVKRKFGPPPQGFHPVPPDLASIFLALPVKKIRVG